MSSNVGILLCLLTNLSPPDCDTEIDLGMLSPRKPHFLKMRLSGCIYLRWPIKLSARRSKNTDVSFCSKISGMGRQLLPATPNGFPKQSPLSETEQGKTKVHKSQQGLLSTPQDKKKTPVCISHRNLHQWQNFLTSKSHKSRSTVSTAVFKSTGDSWRNKIKPNMSTPTIASCEEMLPGNEQHTSEGRFNTDFFFFLILINTLFVPPVRVRKGSCSQRNYSLISGNQVRPSPFDHNIISTVAH